MQRRGRLTARSEGTQQSPAFFSNSVPASHTLMVCRSGYWQSTVEDHSSYQAFLGVTGFLHLAQQVGVSFWLKFSILPNSEDPDCYPESEECSSSEAGEPQAWLHPSSSELSKQPQNRNLLPRGGTCFLGQVQRVNRPSLPPSPCAPCRC